MIQKQMRATKGTRGRVVQLTMALGLAAGLLGGCDGQADPSYQGEPLMRVSGSVEAGLAVGQVEVGVLWLTSSSDFALVCTGEASAAGQPSACAIACGEVTCETLEAWEACVEACPDVDFEIANAMTPSNPFITGAVGQTTPAVGEFPAQFSLDILAPPPEEVLIASTTGERLAIGLFVALDPAGAPFRADLTGSGAYPDWLLGGSESHFVLYTPDGVPAGALWSLASGLVLAPGFHLIEAAPLIDEESEEEEPSPRIVPSGDASQISLRVVAPEALAWPVDF